MNKFKYLTQKQIKKLITSFDNQYQIIDSELKSKIKNFSIRFVADLYEKGNLHEIIQDNRSKRTCGNET